MARFDDHEPVQAIRYGAHPHGPQHPMIGKHGLQTGLQTGAHGGGHTVLVGTTWRAVGCTGVRATLVRA